MLPVIRCDEYIYAVPKFDLTKNDVKDFNNYILADIVAQQVDDHGQFGIVLGTGVKVIDGL